MDQQLQRAEAYIDYRFFRFIALNGARLVMACLFLLAWNLLFFRDRETLIFLGSTAGLAVAVSLLSATVSYTFFKRRGGKVEKTPPPGPASS